MKNIFTLLLVLCISFSFSQTEIKTDEHWTAYALSISSENEETVFNLIDDYFGQNKMDGIKVMLFSILFADD